MSVAVCPADRVNAPAEVVWGLLTDPAGYGAFWDMTIGRVEPPGPAAVGQRFAATTRALCRRWLIRGEVVEVDPARRVIRFRKEIVFGVVGHNRMAVTPLGPATCLLGFG